MKVERELEKSAESKIIKIVTLEKDKYEIYFDFLSIPVEVNKSYLNTIIKDLSQKYNTKISA